MSETAKQRIKKQIERDIKHTLKKIAKNKKESTQLTNELHDLFIAQRCKHEWEDIGAFLASISKCKKCGMEDMI